MNIKLYATYLSSSSERVRIALAMKKLDYEYVSVRDIGWDEIRKINPQGLVPAMVLGDQVITQSNAILHFLEERVPNPSILPSDLILRAQARAFAQAIVCEMHAVDILRIRKFLSKEIGVDNAGLECWSNHWFTTGFSELETTLSARTTAFSYCFGDTPGWAELHSIPHLRKGITRFNLDITNYPLVANIYEKCVGLPEFVKAAPQNQPDWPGQIIEPENESET